MWQEVILRQNFYDRHVVRVSTFELETESFDSKVWISARESFNSFLSSEFSQVSMLSEIALKVISVSMSLSTTTGNSFSINVKEEGEFGNKK